MELDIQRALGDAGAMTSPEGWTTHTIGQVLTLINGRAFKPSEWRLHGLPIIRIQNLNDLDKPFNYTDIVVSDKIHVQAGDLLFAWSGTTGTSFGARIWQGPKAVLNQHIFKVITDQTRIVSYYAFLSLQRAQEDIEKQAHGFKASFVHVRKSDLNKVSLTLPGIPEQRRIASTMLDVDNLVAALVNLLAKKRIIKQVMMFELLTGRTRLPGFGGIWATQLIGDFARVTSGGTPPTTVGRYWGGTVRWMSSGELHKKEVEEVVGRITEVGLRESSAQILPAESVLIGLAGQGKTRGTVAISKVQLCTNQSIAAIWPSQQHDSMFLYYNLDSRYRELRGESTGEGGRGGLNLTIIKKLRVKLPELPEQIAIASVLSSVDGEIAALQKRLLATRNIRHGMTQQLLSGHIRLARSGETS